MLVEKSRQKLKRPSVSILSVKIIEVLQIYLKTQPAIACSKLTIETLEQGVKYVQS